MTRLRFSSGVKRLRAAFGWRAELIVALVRGLLSKLILRNVTFVGITGSAGKTTTKDLCAGILSRAGGVTKTQHSSNEPGMVAMTLAAVRSTDKFAVIEVSGGHPSAMNWPLRLFKPDIAVITLIQKEHATAEFGLEDIANEKFRLVQALPAHGIAVLNIDDPLLRERGLRWGKKVIWVGRDEGATLRLLKAESKWPQPLTLGVAFEGEQYEVPTRLHGEHLSFSVLCALAVAIASGMKITEAIDALQTVEPSEGRMQVVNADDGVTFLRDDWKAPLWSLDAPLEFMRDASAKRKIIVMGTLSDYSKSASTLYPQVAEKALAIADYVVFVGPHALRAIKRAKGEQLKRLHGFSEAHEASKYLNSILQTGDLVLLKGSSRVDHLVRLMLDRETPIACWESRCGKSQFCTRCPRLYDFTRKRILPPEETESGTDLSPPVTLKEGCVALVGLGNPGKQYHGTRHNAGHIVLDALAKEKGLLWQQQPAGLIAEGVLDDTPVLLVKLDAAINLSGTAATRMLGAEALSRASIVIHDDMDLESGVVKVRSGGGDGGHLGVRSIITACQSQDFQRIRLGVRPPDDDRKSRQLVHERLSAEEQLDLVTAFSAALEQALSQRQRNVPA